MTDRKKALEALLEKVEAGTLHEDKWGGMPFATRCYPQDDNGSISSFGWSDADAIMAYHGNEGAAIKLAKKSLPGWGISLTIAASDGKGSADLFPGTCGQPNRQMATSCHAARALLICVVRALIEQEGE